jgi:hypothetical protein
LISEDKSKHLFDFPRTLWDRLTEEQRWSWQQTGRLQVRNEWLDTEVGYCLAEDRDRYPAEQLAAELTQLMEEVQYRLFKANRLALRLCHAIIPGVAKKKEWKSFFRYLDQDLPHLIGVLAEPLQMSDRERALLLHQAFFGRTNAQREFNGRMVPVSLPYTLDDHIHQLRKASPAPAIDPEKHRKTLEKIWFYPKGPDTRVKRQYVELVVKLAAEQAGAEDDDDLGRADG